MNGFEADPALLRAAGLRIGAQAAGTGRSELGYKAKPEQAGDVLLGRALADLQEASARAAKLVLGEARELGARLERAAGQYAHQDENVRDILGRSATGTELG
ncbi:hypothetical protein MUY14_28475 [Amycolatopsis sp. FBCC-B4732]|uniref:hypothetical protein n=1 Tax=Amycolatopsis sp. FBCC-B4732 TaxID=3079339 RepID=UPI001FF3DF60|nr:hypothetical protein [Amycolatopsis sp. FBCC-B4732]UOX85707.1 hypothetical protein MUY14_28475 [Amycolatopsis sp. FBCC-B4732]